MIDAVLSFHMNTQTCGVSKFNAALAQRLGVPHDHFSQIHKYRLPLVSLKFSEGGARQRYPGNGVSIKRPYQLFIHDWRGANGAAPYEDRCWVQYAQSVIAGNSVIATAARRERPDIVTAFCPSTVTGNPKRGAYRVLVFGMAHKLLLPHFEALKQQLEIEHPDYTIEMSTAVHEGSPWDKALTESVEAMRGIFGDKLRVLGFLGDDALAKELRDVDAVAAYYTPALRANNTTAWAALEAGKQLYTNTDADSPPLDPALHSWDMLCALIKGAV
jgi:hypothetical protein